MDLSALQLAERLGGTLLQAPGAASLVIAERLARHGAPQVLVLAATVDALQPVLAAADALQAQGLDLNVVGVLDPGPGLEAGLDLHQRRLGSLLCALQAAPPWGGGGPLLVRRLPGRIRATRPLPLTAARLSPLERSQLQEHDPAWTPGTLREVFVQPPWEPAGKGWTARWWPGVALPPGAEVLWPPLELPSATPLTEALRSALRSASAQPVPFLPVDGDASRLHALGRLTAEVQALEGGPAVWSGALLNLARLPAPAHFCARC